MALYVQKPVTYSGGNFIGAVASFEVPTSVGITMSDMNSITNSDNQGSWYSAYSVPDVGWETSPTAGDWANGTFPQGAGLFGIRVTSIGSNTTPTLADLNNTDLITKIWHSSATESVNGNNYLGPATGYSLDATNLQITTTVDGVSQVIGYDQQSISFFPYSTSELMDASGLRTASLTDLNTSVNHNWYLNGILYGSQTSQSGGQTSSNEDYATDYWAKATAVQADRVGSKTEVISKISSNSDDILEFIVKNALTQNQIHDLYIQLVRDEIITQ